MPTERCCGVTAVAEVRPAGYTVLGWRVSDIQTSVSELAVKGVSFTRYAGMEQDEHCVWTTPDGDKVAWFSDPEGNTRSLTQFS
jgi:hypothetical protein